MKLICQLSYNDCLLACLKNLLAILNKDDKYLYLPIKEKEEQYSFLEIKKLAKQYDLVLDGFEIEDKKDLKNNKVYPLILLINEKDKINHSVLLLKANRFFVKIFDPAKGKRIISYKKFISIWSGRGLMPSSFNKKEIDINVPTLFSKGTYFMLVLFQILSAASIIGGTYMLEKNIYIFFPITCFSLSAMIEVLFRSFCFKQMNAYDKHISQLIPSYVSKSLYERMEVSKAVIFNNITSIIFSIIITAFLIAIMIMNSLFNIILCGVVVILGIIDALLIHPYFEKRKNQISKLEDRTFLARDDNQKALLNELHRQSYKFGYLNYIKKVIFALILILVIILIIAFNNAYSLTNAVFYFFISIYLLDNVKKIFLLDDMKMKERVLKSKLINAIYFENSKD